MNSNNQRAGAIGTAGRTSMAEDKQDLTTLIEHRNAILEVLATRNVDSEQFKTRSDEVIQEFALTCVQDKADELTE